jgi:hypothetical protein
MERSFGIQIVCIDLNEFFSIVSVQTILSSDPDKSKLVLNYFMYIRT